MSVSTFYFDAITANQFGGARWRRGLLAKFPTDKRNEKAAQALEALAKTPIKDVSPEAWASSEPYLDKDYFREALNLANRSIGFQNRPKDFNEYLNVVATLANGFALPASIGGDA